MTIAMPRLLCVVALLATVAPGSVRAGDAYDTREASGFGIRVGGMVVVSPEYEGADEYDVTGVPFIAPSGSGMIGEDGFIQFRGPDDLRLRAFRAGGFEAGPLVGWRFDRDEDDGDRLGGLGDVDGGVVVGGYAAYRAWPVMPFLSYHHQVSGDDTGGVLRFGAEADVIETHRVSLTASAGAAYADDDYMDAYFTVTPAQSGNSAANLAIYDADAGIKSAFVGLSSDVALTERWELKLMARYSRLVGDAADSPIVESEDQFFGGAGLTYRIDLGR